MANLISNTEKFALTGANNDLFDTVCRNIVIFKTPQKTVTLTSDNTYAGYGDTSVETSVSYTINSGIYPAKILNPQKINKDLTFESIPLDITAGDIFIKVKPDAKEFIENGGNENALIDGQYYNFAGTPRYKNYLGLEYYYYPLLKIK